MNIKARLFKGFGFLVAFLWTVSVLAQCDQQQKELEYIGLRALYLNTGGDNWINNSGWPNAAFFNANPTMPAGTDVDTWGGVNVNLNGCIYELFLGNNQLSGSIPPELGDLINLTRLDLGDNQLSGNIPPELGNLNNLGILWLHNNQLSGGIPPELGNLGNVYYMSLSRNELISGSIPPELGNLSNVTTLSLYNNQLSGSIPPELGNLSNVTTLSLYNNQLSGSIPPEIGNLNSLWRLYLHENQLSGSITPELGNLTNLALLTLYENQLCGCYDNNLISICGQLISNQDISEGNNLNASWEDFCANQSGLCPATFTVPFTTSDPTCDNNNGSIELIPPIPTCIPYTYRWDNAPNVQNPTGLSAGTYNFTVSDEQGSTGTGSVILELPEPPVIELGEDLETCLPPDLSLSTGYPNSIWSTGDTGATLPVNDFGTYSVTVTDNGCTDEDDIVFNQKQISLDITPAADIAISPGEYTDITLSGADNYTWSPLDGLDFSDPAYVRAQPETTTLYTITATTNEGCETTAALRVSIGLLPGVFDPTNGTLSLDIDAYEDNQLSIYNRWGVRVFHANPYLTTAEWDGTYNGQLVPKGNYYAVLELEVGEIETEKKRMFIVY